jgi:hypothetical protein
MTMPQVNRISAAVLATLSLVALLAVLSGFFQPPQPDEGTPAHIFQLAIAALVPAIIVFVATADWTQPLRSVRATASPASVLVFAFGALYYLEHFR